MLTNLLRLLKRKTPTRRDRRVRPGIETLESRDVPATSLLAVGADAPGIAERHRGRIFERFYRIDTGRSRALGGTGLGLSIVKHLAMLMHGTVGVEPVEPRGSAFWITLPQGVVSTEVVSHLSH